MSDFADLVKKINEIDADQQVSKKKIPNVQTDSSNTNTAAMADILSKIHNQGNVYTPYTPTQEKVRLAETFKEIEEGKAKKKVEDTQTMQDRFAQFLKSEKTAGNDITTMKANVEEGVAEYELADKGFKKILEMINMLEKMVKENGTLEKRLTAAAGMETARLQPLADMRQALSDAYDACEDAYQDAMGDFVVGEEKEDNTK